MSVVFENNLKLLQKYHAPVYENLAENSPSDISVGVEEVEGKKVLYAIKSEQVFLLDSMYNFDDLLSLWQTGVDGVYNSHYLIFGLGNGMFVRSILKNGGPDIKLFVYEPSKSIFQMVLSEFDLTDILSDHRVTLLLKDMETDEKGLFLYLSERLTYSDIDGMRAIDYINYDRLFPEDYAYFYQCRDDIHNSLIANRSVLKRFGPLFLKNARHNAAYFANGKNMSSLYTYIPENLPAVIVAAGPSLTESLDVLRGLKGKALIICVDSAVSVLLKNDILPDLFVCMDPKKNKGHFADERVKDIPLCCVMSTSPHALSGHRAQCFFSVDENNHVMSFLSEHEIFIPYLSTGGSVANDAMSVAELLGIKNIILIGQDLAYTNNKTHAEGSLRAEWNYDFSESQCVLEGIGGGDVVSSNEFKIYRDWFEREIKRRPDLNVINATPAGTRIHGAIEMDFAEAADKYCQEVYDIDSIFSFPENLFSEEIRHEFEAYMDALPSELQTLKEKIRIGIRGYQSMKQMVLERSYQNNRFVKLNQEVQSISTEVDACPYIYYSQCLMQEEIGQLLQNAYVTFEDEREELKESIQRGIRYLEALGQGIDKALSYLDEVEMPSAVPVEADSANEDVSFILGRILCAATDRDGFLSLMRHAVDLVKNSREPLNVDIKLQCQRIAGARSDMAIQRYAAAIVLSALTGDEQYYEKIQKEGFDAARISQDIAEKLTQFSDREETDMLQCLEDFITYFETEIAPV